MRCLFLVLGIVAHQCIALRLYPESCAMPRFVSQTKTPCLSKGCKPGTGVKSYVDAPTSVRDPQWDLCIGSTCEALVYGGHRGRGTQQGQNEWGIPSPYTKTYRVPLLANETVIAARVNLFASVDSGYTYPNEPPYVVTLTINGQVVGDHVQMTTLLRNPTWLSLPGPPPADGNLRNWTFEIPQRFIDKSLIGKENNITYDLVTPGWMTIEASKFIVDVCGWQCSPNDDDTNGHWEHAIAGSAPRCKAGYQGEYCTDSVLTSNTNNPGSSDDSSDPVGLYIAIGLLAGSTVIFFIFGIVMYLRTQSMAAMSSMGRKGDTTAKIAPAVGGREGSPA